MLSSWSLLSSWWNFFAINGDVSSRIEKKRKTAVFARRECQNQSKIWAVLRFTRSMCRIPSFSKSKQFSRAHFRRYRLPHFPRSSWKPLSALRRGASLFSSFIVWTYGTRSSSGRYTLRIVRCSRGFRPCNEQSCAALNWLKSLPDLWIWLGSDAMFGSARAGWVCSVIPALFECSVVYFSKCASFHSWYDNVDGIVEQSISINLAYVQKRISISINLAYVQNRIPLQKRRKFVRGFLRISAPMGYLANTCSGYDSDNQPQVIEMMRMNNAGCYIPSFISETRTFDIQ